MSDRLLERIDPLLLAKAGAELQGEVPLHGLKRLTPLIRNTGDGVAAHLRFGVDAAGTPYVAGRVSGRLVLACQRCLGDLGVPVDAAIRLGVIASESEAEQLPESYEPLLLEDGKVCLAQVIEDELLLAIPLVPMHAEGECEAAVKPEPAGGARENPFAVLASLKRRS